ncbi:hypothetical protein [Rhizobium tumorigenes]|uniref:hypothetical protein n=1 Tax=Rhizobium tumorigenes TaxID=2041385 RepID=UPI00242047BB|nr:hypothetical protein [Rhizobium tumorigenes]WFS02753.1 hypothetical protein PR016_09200 [Rhizobium tumorigenes]
MALPDISSLPPWLALVFVVCAAITYVVIKTGYMQGGREAEGGGRSQAQVAAVIVDPTALNNLSSQVALVAAALDKIIRTGEGVSESEEKIAEELSRLREELRVSVVLMRR